MGDEKAAATEAADVSDDAYIDGRVATRAIERLRELNSSGQPFFLAVGFRRPHLPFTAPSRYWAMHDAAKFAHVPQSQPPRGAPALALHNSAELRGYTDLPASGPLTPQQITQLRHGYYATTSYVDAQIGRLLDAQIEANLKELGFGR